jgi:hypothetical protein
MLALALSPELRAQSVQDSSAKSDECNIYLQNRNLIKDAEITGVNDSSVFIVKNKINNIINARDIRTIKFEARGGFWNGALIGAGINFGVFSILAIAVPKGHGEYAGWSKAMLFFAGVAGIIPAGLIGGFIGAMSQEDKVYNIPQGDIKEKIKKIREIVKENSQ